MPPEIPEPQPDQNRGQNKDIYKYPLDGKKQEEPKAGRYNDIGIRYIPTDEERQQQTQNILKELKMENAFSQVLSTEEMKSLNISINDGGTLETQPPIHTGSISVSFRRNGKRVGMEQAFRWTGAPIYIDNPTVPDAPDTLLIEKLQTIVARIKAGDVAEKPQNWNKDLDALLAKADTTEKKQPSKDAPIGQIRRVGRGEQFVKLKNDMWMSTKDGGMVDSKAMDKMKADVVRNGPEPSQYAPINQLRRTASGELFKKVSKEMWQSQKDTGMIPNRRMDEIATEIVKRQK